MSTNTRLLKQQASSVTYSSRVTTEIASAVGVASWAAEFGGANNTAPRVAVRATKVAIRAVIRVASRAVGEPKDFVRVGVGGVLDYRTCHAVGSVELRARVLSDETDAALTRISSHRTNGG